MDQEIIKKISGVDIVFNEAKFKSYVDNVFIKIYTAVMLDELESVRHFMSDEVFSMFSDRIDKLNQKNLRQMYDELNVKSTSIISFDNTDFEYVITVRLISRYLDYYLNKDTGDFVSGNMDTRVERENILVFSKKKNFHSVGVVRKCSGCGASISVNTNGVCDYCGVTYNLEDYDYILVDIK